VRGGAGRGSESGIGCRDRTKLRGAGPADSDCTGTEANCRFGLTRAVPGRRTRTVPGLRRTAMFGLTRRAVPGRGTQLGLCRGRRRVRPYSRDASSGPVRWTDSGPGSSLSGCHSSQLSRPGSAGSLAVRPGRSRPNTSGTCLIRTAQHSSNVA
jgi:hypothetical protein